jgi:hypothetical protein
MNSLVGKSIIVVFGVLVLCWAAAAEQEVGKVVAVRGKATIERGPAKLDAKVKSGIQGSDTVKTAAESRAKLLFIDDSVLTLSDNSRLVVTEFIHSKGERGTSIFNLLDGKMRSVVGKTKFEVQTPTAVAAARGTIIFFNVSSVNNVASTKIICHEGTVEVRSKSRAVPGVALLTPGKMIVISAGQTTLPKPVTAPKAELDKARAATSGGASADDKGKDDKAKDDKAKADKGEGDKGQGDRGADGKSGVAKTTGGVTGMTGGLLSTTGDLMAETTPGNTSAGGMDGGTSTSTLSKLAMDTNTGPTGPIIIANPPPPLPLPPSPIVIIPPPPPPVVILPPEITKPQPKPTRVNITINIPPVPVTVK